MTVPIDMEIMRARIGLEPDDPSKDPQIDVAMEVTLDMIEEYLDRKLLYEEDIEELYGPLRHILVRRWPIDPVEPVVVTITDGVGNAVSQPNNFIQSDRFNGIVYLGGYSRGWPIRVEYTGGFQTLPSVLEWAYLQVFDSVWASDPAWGGTAGGGGFMMGDIKKVSLVGVGSVDLGSSSASGGGGTGGDGISDPWSLISAHIIDILDRFRRQSVIGAG